LGRELHQRMDHDLKGRGGSCFCPHVVKEGSLATRKRTESTIKKSIERENELSHWWGPRLRELKRGEVNLPRGNSAYKKPTSGFEKRKTSEIRVKKRVREK